MVKEFNQNFRVGQGGLIEINGNFTIPTNNKPRMVEVDASSGPVTVTLPLALGIGGKRICIIKTDATTNPVTVAANAADTLNGAATDSVSNQFENVDYISDNENEWLKVAAIGADAGHVIQNQFTPLPQQPNLNFIGPGVTAADAGEQTTSVSIPGSIVASNDVAILLEEWIARNTEAFNERFVPFGLINVNAGGLYGRVIMQSNSTVAGARASLNTEDTFVVDTTLGDITFETVIQIGSLTNSLVFLGLTQGEIGNTSTSEANIEAAVSDFIAFIFDPSISANWRLITRSAAVSTRTQTSVAVPFTDVKLKFVFNFGAGTVEFFINGVSVGTHSTNVPGEELFYLAHNSNKTTIDQDMQLSFTNVVATRVIA